MSNEAMNELDKIIRQWAEASQKEQTQTEDEEVYSPYNGA